MKKFSIAIFISFISLSSVSYTYKKKYKTDINTCKHTAESFKCVKYVSAYDGDTITVDIPNINPFFGYHVKVRIKGIDTPELTSKSTCEKKIAEEAKNRTTMLLISAKKIDLIHIGKEKYGRILAEVIADGVNVGSVLLKEKLAYTYDGGTKKKINWCNFKK